MSEAVKHVLLVGLPDPLADHLEGTLAVEAGEIVRCEPGESLGVIRTRIFALIVVAYPMEDGSVAAQHPG